MGGDKFIFINNNNNLFKKPLIFEVEREATVYIRKFTNKMQMLK